MRPPDKIHFNIPTDLQWPKELLGRIPEEPNSLPLMPTEEPPRGLGYDEFREWVEETAPYVSTARMTAKDLDRAEAYALYMLAEIAVSLNLIRSRKEEG